VTVAHQSSGPGLFARWQATSNAPVATLADPSGDALYAVHGGAYVAGLDLLGASVAVSGPNLVVTTKIADLSAPAVTAAAVPGTTLLQ
jgi:hypothetical protein